jgi:signal transduction histidine kinase
VKSAVRGMSLERKLPLLMTGVLLVVLVAGVLVVDREARRAATAVTTNKLQETATTIAQLLDATGARTAQALLPIARNSSVLRALATPNPTRRDLTATQNLLEELGKPMNPNDSGLVTELRSTDGRVIASAGDTGTRESRLAGGAVLTGRDSVSIGSFYESQGRVFYRSTMPITRDGSRVGTIVQTRRVNSIPETEKTIGNLGGIAGVSITLYNADGSLWTTLNGRHIAPPSHADTAHGLPAYDHPDVAGNEKVLVYRASSPLTPWGVAVELPLSKLSAGPRDILNRFTMVSLMLLVLGAVAVWVISRRITTPLARITVAAEAMAKGDYSHRVPEEGDYEIALLGSSFNWMATEVEAANQKLQTAAEESAKAQTVAEAANAAKANFLAAMSHELRTPLNAIAGYVDLLEMGIRGPLTQEQSTDLSRIKRSQQYLLGLIEQVLVFTQLEAHRIAIHLQDVPVDDLMRDAETMVRPQIRSKGIEYAYRPGHPGLVVRADREKAQQILLNLITNGAKYTNPGGRVTVASESKNGSVLVRVSDTGAGIPEKMLTHIFEPFVQLDRRLNQPREGVGLGLTISRDLARAMGGDLLVESAVGVGSTFTLVLPKTGARDSV